MKFSLSWLKEILNTQRSPQEIASTLTSLGLEVDALIEKEGDHIFEVALTPNLFHAANLWGIAREIASVTEEEMTPPVFDLKEGTVDVTTFAKVSIDNTLACPRYLARVITGVKVGPSPAWLVKRVESAGMRSVNIIVDITNYVMLTCGLPLHAFDLDKLQGKEIVVRNANPGEKIVTLDGKEHFPTVETLLICDACNPVAIAGVMGSEATEVTEKTTNLLIEAAYFEPTQVRRTSKRMGIHTEASHRFERGVDPNQPLFSIDFASTLIQELASGMVAKGVLERSSQTFPAKTIPCRLRRINQILGTTLALGEVEAILRRAHAAVRTDQETLYVTFPTFRVDLKEEIDLVEEVARFYGYDNLFEKRKPPLFTSSQIPDTPLYLFEKEVRTQLLEEGLQQMLTSDLISPQESELIPEKELPRRTLVKLLNPGSLDQSVLRPSLLPALLRSVKFNCDHGNETVAGFEIGRVHFKSKEGYLEPTNAAIVLSGKKAPHDWSQKGLNFDFFDLKGILENLFEGLRLEKIEWRLGNKENFHPGQQALIFANGNECGVMGQLHPNTVKKMGVEVPVLFAEFNLDELILYRKKEMKMKPISPFPSSTRDWTVTVSVQTPVEKILVLIEEEQSKFLEECSLLDLYQSEKLGSERKNLTFRFVYRAFDETLSLKAVEDEHVRITQNVLETIKREVEK